MSSTVNNEQQMAEAEALLGDRLDRASFAKGLYFGHYFNDKLPPYPDVDTDESVNERVAELKQFCADHIDPVAIDQGADIPQAVIDGLGKLGMLGACLPVELGGLGLSQTAYCRLLEVVGGHCGSTALFVNAHHSIGPRAVVLFGTREQQTQWLPKLATGEWLSAFALTEPEAGSDAANVQTTAVPAPDGSGFILNGEKRWITNGGIARVLTVMARTPDENSSGTKVTAFVVSPDTPGFQVTEPRMEKMGCRGTVTSRLKFQEMFVPNENVLGPVGGGLRVALTVLDYGRTTFGASCTGAAKFCCRRSIEHVQRRVQFGKTLSSFQQVKEKIARMQAATFAMEAMTYQTAAVIDAGHDEYMLETAMLKVFTTEKLWQILDDTFQLHGGMAYFNDQPFERMIRDARINTIGEGSNDVLKIFIALVGMRDVGLELKGLLDALRSPLGNLGRLGGFAGRQVEGWFSWPDVNLQSGELQEDAMRLGRLVGHTGSQVSRLLRQYQESILDAQCQLGRVADAALELYASSCVLSRLDYLLQTRPASDGRAQADLATGRHYLRIAGRRIEQSLNALWDNDDDESARFADDVLFA